MVPEARRFPEGVMRLPEEEAWINFSNWGRRNIGCEEDFI